VFSKAAGAQSGTIGLKCMIGEPQQFLRGARKAISNIFVILYTIAPHSHLALGLSRARQKYGRLSVK